MSSCAAPGESATSTKNDSGKESSASRSVFRELHPTVEAKMSDAMRKHESRLVKDGTSIAPRGRRGRTVSGYRSRICGFPHTGSGSQNCGVRAETAREASCQIDARDDAGTKRLKKGEGSNGEGMTVELPRKAVPMTPSVPFRHFLPSSSRFL